MERVLRVSSRLTALRCAAPMSCTGTCRSPRCSPPTPARVPCSLAAALRRAPVQPCPSAVDSPARQRAHLAVPCPRAIPVFLYRRMCAVLGKERRSKGLVGPTAPPTCACTHATRGENGSPFPHVIPNLLWGFSVAKSSSSLAIFAYKSVFLHKINFLFSESCENHLLPRRIYS